MPEYRLALCLGFFYKFALLVRQRLKADVPNNYLSANAVFYPEMPKGLLTIQTLYIFTFTFYVYIFLLPFPLFTLLPLSLLKVVE
jgi:hypothetical protein